MTPEERELLQRSHDDGEVVQVTVSDSIYTCCGRGWHDRDFEHVLTGRVRSIDYPSMQFIIRGDGIGTVGFTAFVQFEAVELVEAAAVRA